MSEALFYILGLATPLIFSAIVSAAFWVVGRLEAIGYSGQIKIRRNISNPSLYVLDHHIWWERSWGPVFAGGWYREQSGRRRFNRWVGFGSTHGPCVMGFRKRDLGPVRSVEMETAA